MADEAEGLDSGAAVCLAFIAPGAAAHNERVPTKAEGYQERLAALPPSSRYFAAK